jgi:hypothetical protein
MDLDCSTKRILFSRKLRSGLVAVFPFHEPSRRQIAEDFASVLKRLAALSRRLGCQNGTHDEANPASQTRPLTASLSAASKFTASIDGGCLPLTPSPVAGGSCCPLSVGRPPSGPAGL